MLVAVVALAVVAAAAILTVLLTRAKLSTERERVAVADKTVVEREAEIATARDELASSRDSLAAESAALATATEQVDQLRVDLAGAEQSAAEANERARVAAAATGIEPGVVWPLELLRSDRVWRYSVSPGRPADSPFAATGTPLMTALKVEVDAARNDIGADVELAADLPPDLEPATATVVLRIAQELLADVVRRSDTVTLQVALDDQDVVVTVDAIDRDGEPVLPRPLPVQSPLLESIPNGVRVVVGQSTSPVADGAVTASDEPAAAPESEPTAESESE